MHDTKPGPRPYLSLDEEKEFGSFLKSCANVGYGKTRRDVMHIVQSAVAKKGLLKVLSFQQDDGKDFCSVSLTFLYSVVTPLHTSAWGVRAVEVSLALGVTPGVTLE